jgi:hypothetical protein
MDNQKFTLLVTLASSVTVVLISSAANIWAKWIDNQQKKQDHNFEYNKIYATRKIDAAEMIISNNNLLITQLRIIKGTITAYVENYGYYHGAGTTAMDKEMTEINALLQTGKSTYRLYFDADDNSEKIGKASFECNRLISEIIIAMEKKRNLVEKGENENTVVIKKECLSKWDAIHKESKALLNQYYEVQDNMQLLLLNNCSYFRTELRKYDMNS